MSSIKETVFIKSTDEFIYEEYNKLKKIIIFHYLHQKVQNITELCN